MVKTVYNEIQDLMASIVTINANAYNAFKRKVLSEEKLQHIVNITNTAILKCEQVVRGRFE